MPTWPFLGRLLRRTPPPVRTRGFEAGRPPGRRWDGGGFGPINTEVAVGASTIRRRARQAMANNPHLHAAMSAWRVNLVGDAVTPTPRDPAHLAAWNAWAPVADLAGVHDFHGLLMQAVAGLVVDGEAFLRLVITRDGLRLQAIPVDLVSDESRDLAGGACIVQGIEFDEQGRRVAFYIYPREGASAPVRVPVDKILHVYKPILPGQVRGVSWFAPVLLRARELDELADALLVGAKVGAMFAAIVTDLNSPGPNPFTQGEGEQRGTVFESGLEPGTMKILPSGFDVKFATPQQAQQTADFARHQLRSLAAGLGLPAHLISADLSEANYGSLRGGMIAFRQAVEAVQFGTLVPMLLGPAWSRLMALSALRGEVDDADDAPEWLFPPMPWIDPAKDAEAEATMIAAGLKSRRQSVAERGYDAVALDAEIAADRKREARLGLSFGAPRPASEPANG